MTSRIIWSCVILVSLMMGFIIGYLAGVATVVGTISEFAGFIDDSNVTFNLNLDEEKLIDYAFTYLEIDNETLQEMIDYEKMRELDRQQELGRTSETLKVELSPEFWENATGGLAQ